VRLILGLLIAARRSPLKPPQKPQAKLLALVIKVQSKAWKSLYL
jgi:hypothetical protein